MHNIIKIPYKYYVITLLKLKYNCCPSFPRTFTLNERENATKIGITTRNRMICATNLHRAREFYTTAGFAG